jgi:hypothetical protein
MANHMEMCKFGSADEAGCVTFKDFLEQNIEGIEARKAKAMAGSSAQDNAGQ